MFATFVAVLERVWRGLLWIAAALLLLFGIPSFVAPAWAVTEFPWNVGPFLAQTIGGWAIGTAATAALAAWVARPRWIYALIVYCGLFGLLELAVVVAFVSRLHVAGVLTYPYLLGLASLVVGGVLFGLAWLRRAPATDPSGDPTRLWHRALTVAVATFVTLLAVGTLLASATGATARGEVFPEPMGLFSIRAFSAFLFALAISMFSALPSRDAAPYFMLALAGLALIVPITLPALLNLSLFSFERPGTVVYLVSYVAVAVILAVALAYRQRRRPVGLRRPDAA